jgi:hypothetical protein
VAARWAHHEATRGWQPAIPKEALEYFLTRQAYLPDTPDLQALDEARDSIGALLPRVMDLLRKSQGDIYAMNGSESHGKIFWFFSPPQPIDAFNLTLSIRDGRAFMSFGYTPYTLAGKLDFHGMTSEHATADPEMAGLALMRIVRTVLNKI